MRTTTAVLVSLLLLAGRVSPAAAQESPSPRVILEKAVAAHGGMEQLARVRADWIRLKGTLFVGDKHLTFMGETTVQLPGQFKNVLTVTSGSETHKLVQVLDGEKAWVTVDGQPHKMSATALAEMRETLNLDRAIRLVPLLTEPGYQVAYAGESKVNDRPVVTLKVTAKGRKELRMYFDKETFLLVKTEHTLDDSMGKEVRQEAYYSDFRELGGYRRPTRIVAFRDGKKVMEGELLEAKYLERVPESEFKQQ
jgi:outer membrane lipoprotein-sorting protein